MRLAELDELGSSHERMQIDLIDCGEIFRFRVDELLEVLDTKVPIEAITYERRFDDTC